MPPSFVSLVTLLRSIVHTQYVPSQQFVHRVLRLLRVCRVQDRINKKKEQIAKAEVNAKVREDLKTVALGTSKINYLDPRITVAWCKRNEVPMEKIFNKSLLSKFFWSMDAPPDFKF